jgi:hypothetical protein
MFKAIVAAVTLKGRRQQRNNQQKKQPLRKGRHNPVSRLREPITIKLMA